MIGRRTILRVDLGRWEWWPVLQRVEYLPKRARRATVTLYLSTRQNTEAGALRAVAGYMHGGRADD